MASPVWADLHSADIAYRKSEFNEAFKQFKELAELGQPEAQYNLAVMYVRGEGVPRSLTFAHAWASLSGANGYAKGTTLAAELEPQLTPTSLQISSSVQAQYSQATLDVRLLPRVLKGKEYDDRDPARLHRLGDFPLKVDDQQAVLELRALDLDVVGQRELALEVAS